MSPPASATGQAARSSPKSDRARVRTWSTSSSQASVTSAPARASPLSATRATTGASAANCAGVAAAAHPMSWSGSFTSHAVRIAPSKRRRRLAAVGARRHHRERAAADPRAAPFVAAHRSPAAAARDDARRSAPVRDRARPRDEQDPRAVAERIVEAGLGVGDDHDILRDLPRAQRLPELQPLRVAADAGRARRRAPSA